MILPRPLILASASPQRKKILSKLDVPFRIIASCVSERSREKNPRRLVLELAEKKARAIARRYPHCWVLGSDTVVVRGKTIIGKPKNQKDSKRILEFLNGRRHKVYTGSVLVLDGGKTLFRAASVTRLCAKKLDTKALSALAGKHMDKAGSYAVQDRKDPFIAKIDGPRDNVIGLHLDAVRVLLSKARKSQTGLAVGKTK
jgi:septum formation protein